MAAQIVRQPTNNVDVQGIRKWGYVRVCEGKWRQNQQLRLDFSSPFVCTVFESISPLCAQYLRNI